MMVKPHALYLLPSLLSSEGSSFYESHYYLKYFKSIKHYVVENEKVARAFFKSIGTPIAQAELIITAMPKHNDSYEHINKFLTEHLQSPIGLLSDAGIPCVADPGNKVVQLAHKQNFDVVPVVGPCSMIMALMASGCNGQNFAFCGYLPIKTPEKRRAILALQDKIIKENQTQIFIETPYRNDQLLQSILTLAKPNLTLSVSINLMSDEEKTISKKIEGWVKEPIEIGKVPAVFVLGN